MPPSPRIASITGVARALIKTVGVTDATDILITQFGWDQAFQALAQMSGGESCAALWCALDRLNDRSLS